MNALKWMARSVGEKGVVRTMKIASNVLMDLSFDWQYGTDTVGRIKSDALGSSSENQAHSSPYVATKARPFLRLLNKLNLPRECEFVDIGAGKGRVLLIASQYGFRKVTGIEFSKPLCDQARRNIELFSSKVSHLSPIEVIEIDATLYRFSDEAQVIFMYNPFDAVVLSQVIENVHCTISDFPRKIWLLYNSPQYHEVISARGIFKTESLHEIGGTFFRVYEN